MRLLTPREAQDMCNDAGIHEWKLVNSDWLQGGIRHLIRNVDPDAFTTPPAPEHWIPGKWDGTFIAHCVQRVIDAAYREVPKS